MLANLVELAAIASVGSACTLVVFLLLGGGGYRLRGETGASSGIVLLGMAACDGRCSASSPSTRFATPPETFTAIVGVTALSVVLDLVWKWARDRHQDPPTTVSPA